MKYPEHAAELVQLLEKDQQETRQAGRAFFYPGDKAAQSAQVELKQKKRMRTKRMLDILDAIGDPSISNIGAEGAQAVSVLALHDAAYALEKVLQLFTKLYERDPDDTFYQAIPSMTDWFLLLKGKPQRFGTQWLFDENKWPFLPTVADFERVNERRAEYGIEPLRWPKSLAIPESEQPWLKRPLSELVMRWPASREFENFRK